MHYSQGPDWRPLIDEDSAMLQVATGCSHNRCSFCDMYHREFKVSSIEEVSMDIFELAARISCKTRRLFLTGGNAFCIPTRRLLRILALVRERLPGIESVGCFARITDIEAKSNAELGELARSGLDLVSIGAESGLDEALEAVGKGFSSRDIVLQCSRLDKAKMSYALFYLLGIAGEGKGIRNARASARVFGRIDPRVIMIHTMTCFKDTVLFEDVCRDRFKMASEKENQRELREFCALLKNEALINAAHLSNTISFVANLPEERMEVLKLIDERIGLDDEESLARHRALMKSI